jgi:hypothetical protein
MSVPRSVADVLRKHVTLELECIDRLYLNVYQPDLQLERKVYCYLRAQHGAGAVSSRYFQGMTRVFVSSIEAFARREDIPLLTFAKDTRKEELAAEHRARLGARRGFSSLARPRRRCEPFAPSAGASRTRERPIRGW